jgi:hypothetical protein
MVFRTPEAKRDLVRSWNRPDRPFFAAGACHILAAAFLEIYPDAGYRAICIQPEAGQRGGHLLVSNGRTVFDYHGYADESAYLAHYFAKIRRFFPAWQGSLIRLKESPLEGDFCQTHQLRRPEQYLHDPRPRALRYLKRFPDPSFS